MKRSRLVWVLMIAGTVVLGLRCGDDKGPGPEPRLTLDVDTLDIEVSSCHQFIATYDGMTPEVTWYVEDIPGGDPWVGMITIDGLYVAPDSVRVWTGFTPGYYTVKAKAVADPRLEAEAEVHVIQAPETPSVTVSPNTGTLSNADSLAFSAIVSGCEPGQVTWSVEVLVGDPDSVGVIRSNGTYVSPWIVASTFEAMIRATSLACPDKSGTAKVVVEAAPVPFDVELEDYTQAFNIGGLNINRTLCGAASGDLAVTGMDQPGEYIIVPITVPASGAYVASVWYSSNIGTSIEVRVMTDGCGYPAHDEAFILNEGTGMG